MLRSESVLRSLENDKVRVRAIRTWARIGVLFILMLSFPFFSAGAATPRAALQKLKVSSNGRFLVKEDGTTFFWLNDTAWYLPTVSNADVSLYLSDRAQKRFNCVMFVCYNDPYVLYNGQSAFLNGNTDTPNGTFWQHLDFIVTEAENNGLYVAILPMWAEDYQVLGLGSDTAKAYRLGSWMGTRYRNNTNVIWVVSGEYADTAGWTAGLYNNVAQGLKDGDLGNHQMTIHPGGTVSGSNVYSSSHDFQNSTWLNFNMIQVGQDTSDDHFYGFPEVYDVIAADYTLSPIKPTVMGETGYEHTDARGGGLLQADTVRRKAYWAVFAGGFGHTYGNSPVSTFDVFPPQPGMDWKTELNAPGATQMRHLRALMESRSFLNRIPDQSIVVSSISLDLGHVQATRASDGSYAMVYIPKGDSVTVDMGKISGSGASCSWYDPRNGSTTAIGQYANSGTRTFDAPGATALGNDWILVLDSSGVQTPTVITSPAAGTIFAPGQVVTATGTGTNLSWSIDRIGDGLPAIATGTGPSITFTVPANSTSSQTIQITLTGTGGIAQRTYSISGSLPFSVTIDYVSTGKAYSLSTAQVGALQYIDRSYTITSISSALSGGKMIRTANEDKAVTTSVHLKFTVNLAATVYVCYSPAATAAPTWLNDGTWTVTTEVFNTTDTPSNPRRVYRKTFPAGQVTLGGNRASGSSGPSGYSNYTVVVTP